MSVTFENGEHDRIVNERTDFAHSASVFAHFGTTYFNVGKYHQFFSIFYSLVQKRFLLIFGVNFKKEKYN